ncbi:MAG: PQQ-dependent sugar dehydrogenase, partial [Solirubrobacterales bacterium]
GLAFDPEGQLFATEFGASDFDEVNRIEAGANYGWPEVEGEGGAPEFTDPIQTWRPSEASPAGAAIPSDDFTGPSALENRMLVATLAGERLYSLELSSGELSGERELLNGDLGRLRTIVETPDGELWLATSNRDGRGNPSDGDDRIVRLQAGG